MFLRKKNKKGFTLIEMMAVIAIIAVLVGILVPVVTSYTNRANAAANAANLRSVKGQVATLLMQGQITYETAEDDSPVKTALSEFKQTLRPSFTNPLDSLLYGIVTTIENAITSITEMTNRYNNTYYSDEMVKSILTVRSFPHLLPNPLRLKVSNLEKTHLWLSQFRVMQ